MHCSALANSSPLPLDQPNNMRRFFIALIATSTLFFAMPQHAQAANLDSKILPNCDETIYVVQNKSDASIKEIKPEQFGVGDYLKTNWEVVDYKLTTNCGFNDFLQLFVNLFNWGLYVLSILALFFFFLGGGTLLLSGGSEERVRTGKAILVNTVIGLGIALSSWVIVNLTMNALLPEGQRQQAGAALLNNQPWFRIGASTEFEPCADPPQYPCKGGVAVTSVQTQLFNYACYTNPLSREKEVDGSFGQKTLDAWHWLQEANNVPVTDVLTGAETLTTPCVTDL